MLSCLKEYLLASEIIDFCRNHIRFANILNENTNLDEALNRAFPHLFRGVYQNE
jgi:hypothetical protein